MLVNVTRGGINRLVSRTRKVQVLPIPVLSTTRGGLGPFLGIFLSFLVPFFKNLLFFWLYRVFVVAHGLLIAVASLIAEHGL